MKCEFRKFLAFILAAGLISMSPAVQVLAEEPAEIQADITDGIQAEEMTDGNAAADGLLEEDVTENDIVPDTDPAEDNGDLEDVPKTDVQVFTEKEAEEKNESEENDLVIAPMPDVSSFAVSGSLFDDVNDDSWYLPYVTYTLNKGVMTGKGNNSFAPGEALARAQFAVVLWRISGSPNAGYCGTYPDVPDHQFYTAAVEWASGEEVGVIGGYDEGRFGPNDNITREQMAAMLFRYAKYKNLDTTHINDLKEFPDACNVTEFALEAMQWAVGSSIIKGDKGNLNPQGNTNRAECATMLQRFCETFMPGMLQDIEISASCSWSGLSVTNQQNGEFWLKAEGIQGTPGVQKVQARVWCDDYWSDAYFYNLEKQTDGSWGTSGAVRNHANHVGTYQMQTYVLLDIGVRIPVGDVQMMEVEGTPGYYQVMSHVQNIYDQVGYDLNACYWWCVNNITYRTLPIPLDPEEGYTGSEWYAMQAFLNGSGNCYVFAAVFYYCALGLGYDAEYIEGQVGLAAGGYGPHGWVIINQDGGSYICDPEAQYEIGGYNFYMQPVYSPVLRYAWQ